MTIADNLSTLGLHHEEVVTHDKVRKAYRRLAKKAHPDAHTIPTRKRKAYFKFIKIKDAHDKLLDYIDQNGPIHPSIDDFRSKEGEASSASNNQKAQYDERMRREAESILHEARFEKYFFKMPWVLLLFPSLLVTILTVAIPGMLWFGVPLFVIIGILALILKDDRERVFDKYIWSSIYFTSTILIYLLPVLVSRDTNSVTWTHIYIWWILMAPTIIYMICLQIESLLILRKAKRTLSLV